MMSFICRPSHCITANRPGGGHDPTYVKMLEKKKQLRQAQGQLEAEKRTQRLVDIMEANPTNQSLFYRLVRGQRKTDSTTVMTFDGTSLSGSDLHQAWTSYFEKLATPTDCPEYDKEHKEHHCQTHTYCLYSFCNCKVMRLNLEWYN